MKTLLKKYGLLAGALLLLGLTFALPTISTLLSGRVDRPDPQGKIGRDWIKAPGADLQYAGNEACRSCHPTEFASVATSPHSHSVRRVRAGELRPEFVSSQTVLDEQKNILYTVRQADGRNKERVDTSGKVETAGAEWVFGSGQQAYTYLGQNQDTFLQLRISYYPPSKSWNFTPGSGPGLPFHNELGDPYNAAQAAACFGCHSTVIVGTPSHLDLDKSILNVGCESCHGPCRSHVESVKAGASMQTAMVKPPLYSGPENLDRCGACHRIPVAVSDQNAAADSQLARFPGQALPRSRCFRESAGKLTCITCHNPHQSTAAQGLASFEARCLTCHSTPHGKSCARGETAGCIRCHMPLERIARKLPLQFHNHWIRTNSVPAE